jgi:hypothetical protein
MAQPEDSPLNLYRRDFYGCYTPQGVHTATQLTRYYVVTDQQLEIYLQLDPVVRAPCTCRNTAQGTPTIGVHKIENFPDVSNLIQPHQLVRQRQTPVQYYMWPAGAAEQPPVRERDILNLPPLHMVQEQPEHVFRRPRTPPPVVAAPVAAPAAAALAAVPVTVPAPAAPAVVQQAVRTTGRDRTQLRLPIAARRGQVINPLDLSAPAHE